MPLTLRLLEPAHLPVDAAALRPDVLHGRSSAEVARLTIRVGNAATPLGDLFRIEGDANDGQMVLVGDLRAFAGVGRGMASGRLAVVGDVGPRLGAEMSGGTIEVEGSAGDRAGAEMRGGFLHVRGDAGSLLGGILPGSRAGMREGVILIDGNAGDDAGLAMRRGLIAVRGALGEGAGRGLIAGSIFAFGPMGRHAGMGMKRGSLVCLGARPELPTTFRRSNRDRPPFVAIYLKKLRAWGFPVPVPDVAGPFDRYNGDLIERGQGEILVCC